MDFFFSRHQKQGRVEGRRKKVLSQSIRRSGNRSIFFFTLFLPLPPPPFLEVARRRRRACNACLPSPLKTQLSPTPSLLPLFVLYLSLITPVPLVLISLPLLLPFESRLKVYALPAAAAAAAAAAGTGLLRRHRGECVDVGCVIVAFVVTGVVVSGEPSSIAISRVETRDSSSPAKNICNDAICPLGRWRS